MNSNTDKHTKQTADECAETSKTAKDLRKIAKERGIKYTTIMSKKDLCTVLEMEVVKPLKLVFRNNDTGEEHGFHSIYRASKDMNINPGLLH